MPAYKVDMPLAMAPHKYRESDGALADHETPENALAVNERGAPKEAFATLREGDILYTDAESYEALSDADKNDDNKTLLYVTNERFVADHVKLGTFKELKQKKSASK